MAVPAPLRFAWDTINKFFGDGCPGMAAAISFYTFFSLPALLILLLLLIEPLANPVAVQNVIEDQVGSLIGPAGASQVRTILEHANAPQGSSLGTAIGLVVLIFGATTAFAQLQSALNRAWEVKPDPKRGDIRNFLAKRILSFGMVLVIAFMLLVSLAISAALVAFGDVLNATLPEPWSGRLLSAVYTVLSFAIVALLFAAIFKVIPDAVIAWADVWAGAVATALLFVAGKYVIGLYLGRTDPGNAYGAAGSLAIILVWVYYSAMILLFGTELTQVWAERHGRSIEPEKSAVRVIEQTREIRESA